MSEPALDLRRQKLSEPLRLLADLPTPDIERIVRGMSDAEIEAIVTDWAIWARPDQLLPAGDWRTWLVVCGRGWGKTRTGAAACHEHARHPEWLGNGGEIVVGGLTYSDIVEIQVEGPSGLLAAAPSDFRPRWYPGRGNGLLIWPNGVRGICLSFDKPRAFRGPNTAFFWGDEWVHADRPKDVWDNVQFSLRHGVARGLLTNTPLPSEILEKIEKDKSTHVTEGSTYDNRENLSPKFIRYIDDTYEGTRLGDQEIHGKRLRDSPGALWSREIIDRNRVKNYPDLVRIAVAIDPAVTDPTDKTQKELRKISETGIMVGGIDIHGNGYLLEDMTDFHSPIQWADASLGEYDRWGCDVVVGEVNNGGALVKRNLTATGKAFKYQEVRASRGKLTRAEPVATICEKNRIHHVGKFPKLEDQLCTWEPGRKSPDRMDAYVWLFTFLMLTKEPKKGHGITGYL